MRWILVLVLCGFAFLAIGQGKATAGKEFLIENLSAEKSCRLKYELLLSRKNELTNKGWTLEQLKERAYSNCDSSSMEYLRTLANKFKKKGLTVRLVREADSAGTLSDRQYLIRVHYQLDITKKGMFSIAPVFSLLDSSGNLMFTENSDGLLKKLVNL